MFAVRIGHSHEVSVNVFYPLFLLVGCLFCIDLAKSFIYSGYECLGRSFYTYLNKFRSQGLTVPRVILGYHFTESPKDGGRAEQGQTRGTAGTGRSPAGAVVVSAHEEGTRQLPLAQGHGDTSPQAQQPQCPLSEGKGSWDTVNSSSRTLRGWHKEGNASPQVRRAGEQRASLRSRDVPRSGK